MFSFLFSFIFVVGSGSLKNLSQRYPLLPVLLKTVKLYILGLRPGIPTVPL